MANNTRLWRSSRRITLACIFLGQNHPRTIEAIERLASLYEKTKKPDLAAPYRALLTKH